MDLTCFECGTKVEAPDLAELGDGLVAHARADHEWPFPDQAIRNYAEATQRLTGGAERLPELGAVEVHPITEERIDDWRAFFDHDAFVGTPEWAGCYCLEPHKAVPGEDPQDVPHWSENRAAMIGRLRDGRAFGYLAYLDGRPAGWVNASMRSDYSLYCRGDGADPADDQVIGVACFIIAPPYRRHGMAAMLLDRVLADAEGRGAAWIEAYPFKEGVARPDDAGGFRGPRAMYDQRGFSQVAERERDIVVRRPV
jgi:GNAT superfamily N-acetyltransferase